MSARSGHLLKSGKMEIGVWTFKCQACGKTFDAELSPTQGIGDFARNHPCPHCGKVPIEPPESPPHHITDFNKK